MGSDQRLPLTSNRHYLLLLSYEKAKSPAQAEQAQQRIAAYAARRSRGATDATKARVDDWYRTTLQTRGELEALRELAKLVRGSKGRDE